MIQVVNTISFFFTYLNRSKSQTPQEASHLLIVLRRVERVEILGGRCYRLCPWWKQSVEGRARGNQGVRDLWGRLLSPVGGLVTSAGWLLCKGEVPGAGAPPLAKVMRKEAGHMQRQDRVSGVPLEILEHLPTKPESAYFLLCALTYTSDFMGGCLPTTSLWKKKELTYSSS